MTKQTSALWNTIAGYWAIAYRVIHAKRTAARTHDACVFTTRQLHEQVHVYNYGIDMDYLLSLLKSYTNCYSPIALFVTP